MSGLGFVVGSYATTHLSDRIERKYSIAVIAAAWGSSLLMIGFLASPTIIMVLGFIASATIGLVIPLLYTCSAEHFTTSARASGMLEAVTAAS